MSYHNANEVVKKIFKSRFSKYQIGLETSTRRTDFIFDSVQLLYYKCHKISTLKIDDWEKFEKNNLTIALNILYIKEKEIFPAYISKHNSNREK